MKLKAFTIIEVIVVMLITALLTISLWTGYQFVVKRYHSFKLKNECYNDLLVMDKQLRSDFYQASMITYSFGKRLKLEFNFRETVEYIFEEDEIIRIQSGGTDYIPINVVSKGIRYLYLNSQMTQLVSEFNMSVYVNGRNLSLFYTKKYDPYFLQNRR